MSNHSPILLAPAAQTYHNSAGRDQWPSLTCRVTCTRGPARASWGFREMTGMITFRAVCTENLSPLWGEGELRKLIG